MNTAETIAVLEKSRQHIGTELDSWSKRGINADNKRAFDEREAEWYALGGAIAALQSKSADTLAWEAVRKVCAGGNEIVLQSPDGNIWTAEVNESPGFRECGTFDRGPTPQSAAIAAAKNGGSQ